MLASSLHSISTLVNNGCVISQANVAFQGQVAIMIDHLGIKTTQYEAAKQFYIEALMPLGHGIAMDFSSQGCCGFGPTLSSSLAEHTACLAPFWLTATAQTPSPVHFAFIAPSRAHVDAFYEAALKAGGKDNGAPGVRAMYHPNYYGAFVLDLDGNNIEAVCHQKV